MKENALVTVTQTAVTEYFSKEKIDLIKRTICREATDDELKLFLHQCEKTRLDLCKTDLRYQTLRF